MKKVLSILAVALCCFSVAPARASEPASQVQTQADGIIGGIMATLTEKADLYWHHGDYAPIIALDRIIINSNTKQVDTYTSCAWLMYSLGRTSEAEAYYQELLRNNPHDSYAHYYTGQFYFNWLRDFRTSEAIFYDDITNCPAAGVTDWKMLAHTYEHQGRFAKAIEVWQTIVKRWPNGPAVQFGLSHARYLSNKAQQTGMTQPVAFAR